MFRVAVGELGAGCAPFKEIFSALLTLRQSVAKYAVWRPLRVSVHITSRPDALAPIGKGIDMPIDLKAVQKALNDFSTFAENLVKIFQGLPEAIQTFANTVQKSLQN